MDTSMNEIFRNRVNELLSGNTEPVLYFFKGFAQPQIRILADHPNRLMDTDALFQNGVLNIEALNDQWIDMVAAIKGASGPLVGFYEELLALRDFLPRIRAARMVVIENNMLSPWVPSLLPWNDTLQLFDYQQADHAPSAPQLDALTQFYGDVKILPNNQALLLPAVVEDTSVTYEPFWPICENLPQDVHCTKTIEIGSNDDWAYRLGLLFGAQESALFLQRGHVLSARQAAFAGALSALGIPFQFDEISLHQPKTEYNSDRYLPLLKRYWGENAAFRPLLFYKDPDRSEQTHTISQGQIVAEIVDQCQLAAAGKPYSNIFITAPTGAGKSILFQLPALYLAENHHLVTIVVSPLIALMNDQVDQLLNERGISIAACINSTMTIEQRLETIAQVCSGEKSLLYLAPELLLTMNLQSFLGGRQIGLVVIDEAHTVTSWGRDFRSDYWFLGDFLKKSRRNGLSFPVLCLTATAVYSGDDDVVNDTINELGLERTIIHLGNVKRSNIDFHICKHDTDKLTTKVETAKMDLTVQRMRQCISNREKALAYFPYRSHVDQIHNLLDQAEHGKIRRYHGQLPTLERKLVERDYKSGEAMGLFCTKAFGMGIDVGDIKHVIHFAPTGTLADYVQEIGRAARNPDIQGIAHIDYFPSDMRYVRALNGISEMRQFQLKEMLKKLCEIYNAKQRRNLLISAETFQYLFPEADVENRTKSGLMLLAKDLDNKFSFPVLIVRPKAMLSRNYVYIPAELDAQFTKTYGLYAKLQAGTTRRTELSRNQSYASNISVYSTGKTYLVDMARIWEDFYPDHSFGLFKKTFFETETTVRGQKYRYSPRVKVEIRYKDDFGYVGQRLNQIVSAIVEIFGKYKRAEVKQFTRSQFETDMAEALSEQVIPREKIPMLLDVFTESVNEGAAYSQARSQVRVLLKRKQAGKDDSVYFVNNVAYARLVSYFDRQLAQCAPMPENNTFYRFYPMVQNKPLEIMPLLRLLELMELASYEIRGGEKAEVFIRINDPSKLQRLASGDYKNHVLRSIRDRHQHNHRLLAAFFMKEMSTEERWELIEQYFLGHEDYVAAALDLNE